MTVSGTKAEAVGLSSDTAPAKAQSADRARIVARPVPLASLPVTDSDRRGWWHNLSKVASAVMSGAHITGQPPSIAEAHKRVHQAVGKWNAPAARWLRLSWGYLWLAGAVIPGYAYIVITEYPLIALTVAGLIVLAYFFL